MPADSPLQFQGFTSCPAIAHADFKIRTLKRHVSGFPGKILKKLGLLSHRFFPGPASGTEKDLHAVSFGSFLPFVLLNVVLQQGSNTGILLNVDLLKNGRRLVFRMERFIK